MHLTQVDTVSDAIYHGGRGKYIKLENVNVLKDDGTLPSIDISALNAYINQPIHCKIRDILKPTDEMQKLINEHSHLVSDVSFAVQIRRCGLIKNQETFKEPSPENGNFCTDETLKVFHRIVETFSGNVFVTSDCQEVKREFKKKWPERVRILDLPSMHTTSLNENSDPMVPILEFFLLSQCPFIFVTGGDPVPGICISTFGYMAAVYGHKEFRLIFNQ